MWRFINVQNGLASAVLDFTNELSPLLIGLVGVLWLSVGFIVFMAVHYYLSQSTLAKSEAASAPTNDREAA